MRLNVYTEELYPFDGSSPHPVAEIVEAKYISSRDGKEMSNWGLRIYLKSSPDLHYIPGRDDDRSAITFWMGKDFNDTMRFLEYLGDVINPATLRLWREKTAKRQAEAEAAIKHD